ncbi:hypothetical protein [Hymenobacter crusticola]|uniref:Uncharacterized protein n=1 Tax=Hymenobacter crusticola TaxID=1770526 RepID=A0A243W9T9_9BACT|nr:hypothetical protein [Hymenobacter crusticola]OUJ70908.1 hypothetical protein BXP70_23565 [Hymenobacter crusticola]
MSENEVNLRAALYKGNPAQAGRWLSEFVQEQYTSLKFTVKQQAALVAICQTVVMSNQFLTPAELLQQVSCCIGYIS